MTIKLVPPLIVCVLLGAYLPAEAQPVPPWGYGGPPRFAPYVYGPRRFGPYGYRPYGFRRSYGTGYDGRGTATGGPVGGLPSRD